MLTQTTIEEIRAKMQRNRGHIEISEDKREIERLSQQNEELAQKLLDDAQRH